MPFTHQATFLRARLWICLALAAAAFAVYWPVTRADFITFDDMDYVIENQPVLQGLTWPGVVWALQTGHAGNWHPLTWLSHMLDVQFFGLTPGLHHLVNLLFHAANTILVFLLFDRMTRALWQSAFVAALFALHPLHVESVAWVSERKDVLSTFFGLLALGAYVRYVQRSKAQSPKSGGQGSRFNVQRSGFKVPTPHSPSSALTPPASGLQPPGWPCYLLSLLLFALSLMSKPMLVTLPFLLLLLDYWPLNRLRPSTLNARLATLGEKLPFLLLSVVSSVITILVQRAAHALLTVDALPLGARIGNALVSYLRYLAKMVWPSHLALPYPYPESWPMVAVLAAGLVLVGVSVVTLWRVRRQPALTVGWFWFVGTLVPVIGLVQVGSQALADRYTYVPSIGLFVLLAWLVPDWLKSRRHGRTALATVGSAAVLACAGLARVQAGCWSNSVTLFEHTLRVTADNAVAHAGLGMALMNEERLADALAEFSRALTLRPAFAKPLANMAEALCAEGRLDVAAAVLRQILEVTPDNVAIRCRLGSVAARQGNWDEAIAQYESALRLNPRYHPARTNLEAALARRRLK
ncbi:MAG TPA: tetratricopeptide repeat protein [Candidatus Paceibacterota bacterium]|nr:tetratricopeptide repeat protein [Verrucomicrobiota bacterium]HSA11918.1 tetratricopeptide repeat protein [Candidatus Paceibacterota bacterium]